MPVSTHSAQHQLRDPWLPAQVLLQPRVEHDEAEIEDLDLSKMDEDPLIYFLTPSPSSYVEDDTLDFDMDFDAGIEDPKHPPPIVRSVSPSSLAGLSRPTPRPATPPRSPATPDLEYDLSATPDENEHYDYMDQSWPPKPSSAPSLPRRLKDKFRGHPRMDTDITDNLAPPASPYSSHASSRGRAVARLGPKPTASNGGSSRARRPIGTPSRLSPHAWREPSPDVWSIEEQPEEEMENEMGDNRLIDEGAGDASGETRAVDIPAAKPKKKKVRFVLPSAEDSRDTY
ncbi:hypothetical protein N657DRAFT_564927 [Parathielavia appendiculata]|uniref:Uncharacterized protein n=1 Tax=Parathielavia appendiculata TaxID=2587402 RepID=A0AAN6Z7K4_9PEZI|nr:hypothetical protein N657DRAFT_564927 [Parathielavia appendiculata]